MMQQETHSLKWLHYMIIINLCFFYLHVVGM